MEKSKKNKDEKTLPELQMELDRARRMGAMIKAIGDQALELQLENELLKERLAAMSPEGGAPVTTEPGEDGHKSLTPGTTFDCLAVTQVQVFPFKDCESLGNITPNIFTFGYGFPKASVREWMNNRKKKFKDKLRAKK